MCFISFVFLSSYSLMSLQLFFSHVHVHFMSCTIYLNLFRNIIYEYLCIWVFECVYICLSANVYAASLITVSGIHCKSLAISNVSLMWFFPSVNYLVLSILYMRVHFLILNWNLTLSSLQENLFYICITKGEKMTNRKNTTRKNKKKKNNYNYNIAMQYN